ncbi:hypothetical protein CDD81_3509 [Ophiocordyceps australis]|uniref:Cell surface protein n=1 Tax=Ophiocordyceps australis TaxID=1399860 RepID=A0A2C5XV54_9HYPO|nr:hypothetical protein CDD81_3509 [Ophiocordyceps australis]
MRYAIVYSALVAGASAHGLVTSVEGANGVSMPGLSVADGTPRDCSTNSCGSQADTSIIRDRDMSSGRGSALGRTQGNGPVDAGLAISSFMGMGATAPKNNGAASSVGVEDDLSGLRGGRAQRRQEHKRQVGRLMNGLMGLVGGGSGNTGILGVSGAGGSRNQYSMETKVSDMSGMGKQQGLPTANDNGEIAMVYRQINQDGAGPLTATIDPTSGGTDPSAFITARMTKDVPGLGIQGLSLATNTDYPIAVQMPEGMTCEGKVGGADNVCIVRVRNGAITGPFGGSGAFTQSPAARKRAIAYRLKKRFEISREEDPKAEAKADLAEMEEEDDE